jgi:membrane glycosyltransferase
MLPVVLGLAFAIPLAAFTARTGPGEGFRRLGLLLIPEEVQPLPVLAKANALYHELKEAERAIESGLARLMYDPVLVKEHRRMLPPPRRKGQDPIDVPLLIAHSRIEEADTGAAAWIAMSQAERAAALGDAQALDRLLALSAATASQQR